MRFGPLELQCAWDVAERQQVFSATSARARISYRAIVPGGLPAPLCHRENGCHKSQHNNDFRRVLPV